MTPAGFLPAFTCWRCHRRSAMGARAASRMVVPELYRDLRSYRCDGCGADNVLERTPIEWAAIDRQLSGEPHARH